MFATSTVLLAESVRARHRLYYPPALSPTRSAHCSRGRAPGPWRHVNRPGLVSATERGLIGRAFRSQRGIAFAPARKRRGKRPWVRRVRRCLLLSLMGIRADRAVGRLASPRPLERPPSGPATRHLLASRTCTSGSRPQSARAKHPCRGRHRALGACGTVFPCGTGFAATKTATPRLLLSVARTPGLTRCVPPWYDARALAAALGRAVVDRRAPDRRASASATSSRADGYAA